MISNPHAIIWDNIVSETDILAKALSDENYAVTIVDSENKLKQELKKRFFHFVLFDISHTLDGRDTIGLTIGEELADKYPGCIFICTTGKDIADIDAKELIDALNPNLKKELRRVFTAFGDKTSGPNRADKYVVMVRNTHVGGGGDRVEINYESDPLLIEDVESGFRRFSWHGPDDKGEFLEIVKRLSHHSPLPAPAEIRLEKMGKGRSNTLVCSAELNFAAPANQNMKIPPLRMIFKIGKRESTRKEADNLGNYAWRIVHPKQYPKLESMVELNGLGGLAYTFIDEDKTTRAKTLGDHILNPQFPLDEVILLTQQALCSREVSLRATQAQSLLECLCGRFHRLASEVKRKEYFTTVKARWTSLSSATGGGSTVELRLLGEAAHVLKVVPATDLDFEAKLKYELAQPVLQHGDFHSDNILCTGSPGHWQLFFIDFANTGYHSICLDYVVLEVALRYQLLRHFEDKNAVASLPTDPYFWGRCEVALLQAFYNPNAPVPAFPSICGLMPLEVQRALTTMFVARQTYTLQYLRPTGGPNKDFPPMAAFSQYAGGVALSALSALGLPMKPAVEDLHQKWMSSAFGVALTVYNRMKTMKKKRPDADPSETKIWLEHVFDVSP